MCIKCSRYSRTWRNLGPFYWGRMRDYSQNVTRWFRIKRFYVDHMWKLRAGAFHMGSTATVAVLGPFSIEIPIGKRTFWRKKK